MKAKKLGLASHPWSQVSHPTLQQVLLACPSPALNKVPAPRLNSATHVCCQQGSIFPSAKPALAALGLLYGASERPASPPSIRRKSRNPSPSRGAIAYAPTNPRPRENRVCGPAYLLKGTPTEPFPPSPFGIIEELLTDDPWKLLLVCIMLNQTTRSQVR